MRSFLECMLWSVLGLLVISPLVAVVLLTDPRWYNNLAFWVFVLIPGVGGAMAFGPALYLRRRKLRGQEFRASGRASGRR